MCVVLMYSDLWNHHYNQSVTLSSPTQATSLFPTFLDLSILDIYVNRTTQYTDLFLFCIWMLCLNIYLYAVSVYMPGARGGQQRVSDPLELEGTLS